MGERERNDERAGVADRSGENKLRGKSLNGAEVGSAADHTTAPRSDTDAVLRLDNEEDTLYEDGLDLEDDSRSLSNTDGLDNSTK